MKIGRYILFVNGPRIWWQARVYRGREAAPSMLWQANVGPFSVWKPKP